VRVTRLVCCILDFFPRVLIALRMMLQVGDPYRPHAHQSIHYLHTPSARSPPRGNRSKPAVLPVY
jgi:hypothetical protein